MAFPRTQMSAVPQSLSLEALEPKLLEKYRERTRSSTRWHVGVTGVSSHWFCDVRGVTKFWLWRVGCTQQGAKLPALSGPFQKCRARSKGASTEAQEAGLKKNVNRDIFKLFPASAIELLKPKAPRSMQTSPPKNETILGPQRPIHNCTYPGALAWASGKKVFYMVSLPNLLLWDDVSSLYCGNLRGVVGPREYRSGGEPPAGLVLGD